MVIPVALFLLALIARALGTALFPDPAYPDSFYYVAVARELAAAALTAPEDEAVVPLNTCYVAALSSAAEAEGLSAWLNSTWMRAVARASGEEPVAEIALAVQDLSANPSEVRTKLDVYLARLEAGLADARRELARLHSLLDLEERLMTRVSLTAADLFAALDAVRFAAAGAGDPIPAGVLVETTADGVTLVATDRYRLAVATAAAEVEGSPARHFLPLAFADEVRSWLAANLPS